MLTPTPQSCRSAAKPFLGALRQAALAATLLALAPAAFANDRDLRGTPVPAAACIVTFHSGVVREPSVSGWFSTSNNADAQLRCPLPVNNVELSGTSNDNDISKFRVHYRDCDSLGGGFTGTFVAVEIIQTTITPIFGAQSTTVCEWLSNVDGTGATSPTRSTKACALDLAPGAFYHLRVLLDSDAGAEAQFLGVDFPA